MAMVRLPPASISPGTLLSAPSFPAAWLPAASLPAAWLPAEGAAVADVLLPPPQPDTIPAVIAAASASAKTFFDNFIIHSSCYIVFIC